MYCHRSTSIPSTLTSQQTPPRNRHRKEMIKDRQHGHGGPQELIGHFSTEGSRVAEAEEYEKAKEVK